jgi:serine/threonine protein kinase/CHASE2 domain-containing sensor protein
MWGDATRRRVLRLLAVGLLAAAAGLAAHAAGLLGRFERDTVDVRLSLRGRQPQPANVVVVGIDNDSLGQLPRYPFSRRLHARVLENLHAAGARLVVYDISFDRPTTPAGDEALFEAARRAAPVVFATSLISPSGATEVLGGNANLAGIGDQAAAADLLPDPDGVLRHTLAEVNGLPSVAASVARALNARVSSRGRLRGGWIDFAGPPGTLRTLSFVQVLRGHFDPAMVRGKVVVVGATAPVLQDLHSTAAGSPMSGPEVQGEAIATALAGFPLRSPSGVVTGLIIVILALLAPLASMRLETVGVCLVGVGLIALWSVATQLTFNSGMVLDYGDPLLALALGTGGAAILGMWEDSRERRRLRQLFAGGTSAIVEQVLHAPGERRLEPTAIIAGYRLERVVGRGGMGVVYQAIQLALERPVAIKLIAAEHARDPVFRERFKVESRIASSIEHANVIPVYEAGEDDGLLFIAMRLVEGVDLAQLLAAAGALEATRTAHVIGQVAGALDAAHARGLVHRDVKPANVLLTLDEPEHAYLTDFGVAKPMGALTRVTRVGQWVGTLDYMAPEQIRGETLDAGADIYALTGLLYHCLTGQTAFPRETDAATLWAHMSATPLPPSRLCPSLPQELDEVIARGMAKDSAERFSTAADLAHACARAVGIEDSAAPTDSPTFGDAQRRAPPGDWTPTILPD